MKSDRVKPLPTYLVATPEFERLYVRPHPGTTLIVGSRVVNHTREDRRARYKECLGIDQIEGPGVDLVCDAGDPEVPARLGKFFHVDCLSVLEHTIKPWCVAENIVAMMHKDATLFVSVPFVWREHGYPNDYFRFTTAGVASLFTGIHWHSIMYANTVLNANMGLMGDKLKDGYRYFPRTEVLAFGVKT